MKHRLRGFGLAAALVLVSVFASAPASRAQSTATTSAYVYVQIQGPQGAVYGFRSSSAGKLSAISGAPWKTAGQIIGSTPTKFFTLSKDALSAYEVGSDGALGSELGQTEIFPYDDGCDDEPNYRDGAVLDHTGRFLYVLVLGNERGNGVCAEYITYRYNDGGTFTYVGYSNLHLDAGAGSDLPSLQGDEVNPSNVSFGYADKIPGGPIGFERENDGFLSLISINNPTFPGSDMYTAYRPDAAPGGGYVVLQVYAADGSVPVAQLGSFSMDSAGNLSSTNAPEEMPFSPFPITGTTFSPSSQFFVAYGDGNGIPGAGSGIEIYNFNSAAPLTPYKTLLRGTPINQVVWDSSNHMYAISTKNDELYVFTVTPTSVTQDAVRPIGSPYKMLVVSQ